MFLDPIECRILDGFGVGITKVGFVLNPFVAEVGERCLVIFVGLFLSVGIEGFGLIGDSFDLCQGDLFGGGAGNGFGGIFGGSGGWCILELMDWFHRSCGQGRTRYSRFCRCDIGRF